VYRSSRINTLVPRTNNMRIMSRFVNLSWKYLENQSKVTRLDFWVRWDIFLNLTHHKYLVRIIRNNYCGEKYICRRYLFWISISRKYLKNMIEIAYFSLPLNFHFLRFLIKNYNFFPL
jgi:hypothetical protein